MFLRSTKNFFKAGVSRQSVIFFSHFVWGKIMAATSKDRGNSWASRAPLNDDRAPIVAKLVEATFSG